MSPRADTAATIAAAIAAMGPGPLTEEGIARHVAPLFSRVLHPIGRSISPIIRSAGLSTRRRHDVAEAVGLWQSQLGNAWDAWLAEIAAYRGAARRADARAARRLRRAEDQRGAGSARHPEQLRSCRRAWWRPAANSIRSI